MFGGCDIGGLGDWLWVLVVGVCAVLLAGAWISVLAGLWLWVYRLAVSGLVLILWIDVRCLVLGGGFCC